MLDSANAVSLTVDGLDYGGWKKVEISAGLERQARDFNLSITWRWPGQTVSIPIRQGAKCQVRIGGDLILTGWVFSTPISAQHRKSTGRALRPGRAQRDS